MLRPGGYWILSGPPINWKTHYKGWARTQEDLKEEQDKIEDGARRLCWRKVTEKDNLAIWQKPWNHVDCVAYHKKNPTVLPHVCSKLEDPDHAWYANLLPLYFILYHAIVGSIIYLHQSLIILFYIYIYIYLFEHGNINRLVFFCWLGFTLHNGP